MRPISFKFPPPPPPPHPSSLLTAVSSGGARAACAACKHQRKKCTSTCIFAPYFPQTLAQKFEFAHQVFGIKNMSKMAEKLAPERRGPFFDSLVVEARERILNPVEGCTGQLVRLRMENQDLQQEIVMLREQLRMCENLLRQSNGNVFANYSGNYGCLYGNGFPLNGVQGSSGGPVWADGE